MPNAIKSRAATGDRSPGLIDNSAIFATHFFFESQASLKFGGNNEHVIGPVMDSLGLTFTNQFSVGIWVKWDAGAPPNSFQGIANASTTWNALNDGWGMYWQNATEVKFFVNHFNNNAARSAVGDVNAWNFMVGVYDGTLGSDNIKLYVNGVVGATTDILTANVTQPANVELGRTGNAGTPTGDYAIGNLDEFGLWNTALSSDAITTLYNSGAPTNTIINSGNYMEAENLALWWRCGEAGDSNTSNGINDRSIVGNSNPGTMTNMEDSDIDTVVFAGA